MPVDVTAEKVVVEDLDLGQISGHTPAIYATRIAKKKFTADELKNKMCHPQGSSNSFRGALDDQKVAKTCLAVLQRFKRDYWNTARDAINRIEIKMKK